MIAIARSASSSASRPVLATWIARAGLLVDPATLAFVINDISDDTKRLAPVEVLSANVDLDDDRIGAGLGHFAAAWTVDGAEALGAHEILWTATFDDGAMMTWRREFDVLLAVGSAGAPGYALVSDFRAEGVVASGPLGVSDAKLLDRIARWSAWIDRTLGRWFEPRARKIHLDGTGKRRLGLGHPIIAIGGVATRDVGPIDNLDSLQVYNRHLADGLLDPDDRDAPAIEWINGFGGLVGPMLGWSGEFPQLWAHGQGNIEVDGVFGYTDPDGSPEGATPEDIRRATQLLVMRDLAKLTDVSGREDARDRQRITSERTREQSYTLGARGDRASSAVGSAYFSGDPQIDDLLERFAKPIRVAFT